MMEQALDQFLDAQDRAYADPCQDCSNEHWCEPEFCAEYRAYVAHVRATKGGCCDEYLRYLRGERPDKDYGDPCEGCPSFRPGCQPNCTAQ